MRQLVGHQGPTQYFEPLTARRRLERPVVDVGDELRRHHDIQSEPEPAEPPQATEHEVRQICVLALDVMVFHEGAQQGGVPLLLAHKKLGNAHEGRGIVLFREPPRAAQQCGAFGLLADLEGGHGTRDQAPLLGLQRIGQAWWDAARMRGVVLKMIEPDFEVAEHGGLSR